jgi:diphthine synthase
MGEVRKMLYIIGLGLNEKGISKEGLLALEKCKKVYLESYTIDFPYEIGDLKLGKKKIIKIGREEVESDKLIKEAKGRDIALLVYGSPLFATTHISLIMDAEKQKIKTKIIYSASVLDAIAETGLQPYKFGKITNITKHKSESFFKIIEENKTIGAHSLILLDIGLSAGEALKRLQEEARKRKFKLEKVIVCSRLGTQDSEIKYGRIDKLLKEEFKLPACIILPGGLHFIEKEAIERFIIII